ncbi:hypothetical protein M0804_007204 [Polistes exclamans]|nr:hypothetical protein M0804_007204 [Polistes exclamans]
MMTRVDMTLGVIEILVIEVGAGLERNMIGIAMTIIIDVMLAIKEIGIIEARVIIIVVAIDLEVEVTSSLPVTTYQSLILPINWRNALTKFHMDLIVQHFIFNVTSSLYVTYSLKKSCIESKIGEGIPMLALIGIMSS